MLKTSKARLLKFYSYLDFGREFQRLLPGDLLVYKGHVVLLEKLHKQGRADIIHATGGRDLKGPGLGVQRERMVEVDGFRGPLLRVLRHTSLRNVSDTFRRVR
jgi:hypothetical protein